VPSYPEKLTPGDRVAIVSPSAGLPALFPHVYELGLRRLTEVFGLIPVEYPTTRVMDADPRDRARDVTAAFADPSIAAVMATVGGEDQLTILRHLDDDTLRANPKPYFGYSDNTTLLNHLFGLGIVGFHGGSVMVHLGRPGDLHACTAASLRAALFEPGWQDLWPVGEYSDEPLDWENPANLDATPPMAPGSGWTWLGPRAVVEAPTWGGNIEVLSWLLMADRVGPAEAYAGHVFFFETSEELPPAIEVYRILRSIGERGLLAGFPAILVGRPKAWDFEQRNSEEQKRAYAEAQRVAVMKVIGEYAPEAVVVFDLDIGHTDPQLILPYGGAVRVDAVQRRISVRY
jgi:muramoyltetrapeptide carboxypeptidase LdcA involved in peptidoglycan recycling